MVRWIGREGGRRAVGNRRGESWLGSLRRFHSVSAKGVQPVNRRDYSEGGVPSMMRCSRVCSFGGVPNAATGIPPINESSVVPIWPPA